jgi:curved DNA-binding protein CbpA
MVKKEYYKILGIEENVTESDIRRAYIKLAKETHPDRGGNEEEFKKVNKAYEILIDKSKRKEYDNGNENVSVEKYGYDYGETVEESAIGEHLKDLNYLYNELRKTDSSLISDYHLVRGKRFLQVLHSYYEPICKKIG